MVKKVNTSKAKPVDYKEPQVPVVDMFNDAKEMFIMTVKTARLIAERGDNLMNIRDYVRNFYGAEQFEHDWNENGRMDVYFDLLDVAIEVYDKIIEIAKGFEYDDFCKEEFDDPFEDLIPKARSLETETDMCVFGIIWLTARPYIDKTFQLHRLVQDELAKRRMNEGE